MKRTNEIEETHGPSDSALREALQGLPRAQAKEGFSHELLARLPEEAENRVTTGLPRFGRLAAVFATALVATLGLSLMLRDSGVNPETPASSELAGVEAAALVEAESSDEERLRDLLAERQAVLAELRRVRRQATPRPMLYLGGDESVDLVVDLSRVARRHPSNGASPAVYRPR